MFRRTLARELKAAARRMPVVTLTGPRESGKTTLVRHAFPRHDNIQERTYRALTLLLAGGPILFLAAQGWYLRAVPNVSSRRHLAGAVALLVVGLATLGVRPHVALVLAGVSPATFAILD